MSRYEKIKRVFSRIGQPVARYDAPAKQQAAPRNSPTIQPRDPAVLSKLAGEVALRTFPREEIDRMQREIHEQTLMLSRTIDRPNFTSVGRDDLMRMIRMYDDRFFGGRILPVAMAEGLTFGISSRMTSVAGKLVTHYSSRRRSGPRKFELVLSSTLLFQTFEDVDRPVEVTGRMCRDRLEAMQRVAEHEFTHLIEMLIWNDGNCSESRFQSIANRYFAHTDYRHALITQRERAAIKFDIRVGDQVKFRRDGRVVTGRVNRITRRATILVNDPKGEPFNDGKRYTRFYVPLEQLTKVS
ncbi:hypothetical protein Poly51_52320 [Rubripirellula tenax]|uniref:SprT-like family protein n=1 Tax=Rubripirellula tenax TaxID=2528015 RepID=A0A5C6EEI3_9BACT|nr:hypothetical protein [Rubripirellula tenax]TWU47432.1 hypothetical protein Poly51_52320 [Rubripirellula tenax]